MSTFLLWSCSHEWFSVKCIWESILPVWPGISLLEIVLQATSSSLQLSKVDCKCIFLESFALLYTGAWWYTIMLWLLFEWPALSCHGCKINPQLYCGIPAYRLQQQYFLWPFFALSAFYGTSKKRSTDKRGNHNLGVMLQFKNIQIAFLDQTSNHHPVFCILLGSICQNTSGHQSSWDWHEGHGYPLLLVHPALDGYCFWIPR